jgi:DNA-binding CsgD family transcriptional regulator
MHKTFQVSASPIFDDNKKLTSIVHLSRDITYRKLTEKALQATNDKMETEVEQRTKELRDTNLRLKKKITERKLTEMQLLKRSEELDVKSKKLEEANIALRVMLNTREIDQGELEEKVLSNVKELILPYIEALKNSRMNNDQKVFLKTLESNVKKIISPFTIKLSSVYLKLTPKEIQIANLVKNGRTNKEVAELLHVSLRTIEFHREHIRGKLGIKNGKINLRSHLLTFE